MLIKSVQKQHELDIIDKISNVRNNIEFWKTINCFRKNSPKTNEISSDDWIEHVKKSHPPRVTTAEFFYDARHPYLDADITLEELITSLCKCKNNKSPGPDGISYEFFKNLSPKWTHYILNMFNIILFQEDTPTSWSKIDTIFLHKKGDINDPHNYRPIALINNIAKIFTQIIHERLYLWSEQNNMLPEEQFGFRKNRGTLDCIFSLRAITSINLRLKKSNIYAIFVDFKSAFDSVNQDLLWNKLFSLGVSSKLVRLMKNFYSKANTTIQNSENSIDLTTGVLQGDVLSPLLFSLFISDIKDFFYKRGARGLDINGTDDLLLLLYADDIALLAYSQQEVRQKLNILQDYCKLNRLTVNVKKTKILHFHHGRPSSQTTFLYDNMQIELVNKFCYLGVTFSSSGKFLEGSKSAISKANLAMYGVIKSLIASKSNSWESKMILFDSIVSATLLYGAEVWSLNYLDIVETVQLKFLKRLLHCPLNTPNYMARLETGRNQLSTKIWKNALNWWCKLLDMPDTRIPKMLYNRLLRLDNAPTNKPELNWASQMRVFMERVDYSHVWHSQNAASTKTYMSEILSSYSEMLHKEDLRRLDSTSYSSYYPLLKQEHRNNTEPYLTTQSSLQKKRILCQLRLANKDGIQIYRQNVKYKLDALNPCTICNLQRNETLHHFLQECPIYQPIREKYFGTRPSDQSSESATYRLLNTTNNQELSNIYYFTIEALKIRSFIINE